MKAVLFILSIIACALNIQTAVADEIINCESYNNERRMCHVPYVHNKKISLVSTFSRTMCEQGKSWGINNRGIWVQNGCRGRFLVKRRLQPRSGTVFSSYNKPRLPYQGPNYSFNLRCESFENQPNMCKVRGLQHKKVQLLKQLSNAACIRDRTWGTTKTKIWVRRGCRAIFKVIDLYDRNRGGYGDEDERYWGNSRPDRYRLRGSSRY